MCTSIHTNNSMRWTQTFIPTLKESPAEAEIVSHQLLLRAGLVRKLTSGLYTFLPLGLRSLRKIERIVREEMDRAGAIEVLMPALQPTDIWQQSGRYVTAREVLYKVRDRTDKEWLLGPTHEEVITALVASEISSYRQFPKNFYQIQTKFRDEIRPRFGLMRAREFIMKDAYSFDISDEAAEISYKKMYDAYTRIFRRCGLHAFPVQADTGVIGGTLSHEFMVPAETGENEVVCTKSGSYAANIEKATSRGPIVPTPVKDTGPEPEPFPTPGVVTIDALSSEPYNVPAHCQIKTLVYVVESSPVIVLLRGDDQLNEAKLAVALGTNVFRPATPDEIYDLMGAHPGSLGAVKSTLSTKAASVPVHADIALRNAAGMTTGANKDGYHLRHVNIERDVSVHHWQDLRVVKAGEVSVIDGQPLEIWRAIEVGHVFKLGTKYSEKLGAVFIEESGARRPCIMGCYGIGVTRTLQAVIEQSHDKDGIIWPLSVAPFEVCITPLNAAHGSPTMVVAENLYRALADRGVEVIIDDRDERPGVKFKDADLVGFPMRINVGEKSLARDEVELKPRAGKLSTVKVANAADQVMAWIQSEANKYL